MAVTMASVFKSLYLPNLWMEVVILALMLDTGLKFYAVPSNPDEWSEVKVSDLEKKILTSYIVLRQMFIWQKYLHFSVFYVKT